MMGGSRRKPGPLGVEQSSGTALDRYGFDAELHKDPVEVGSYVSFQRVGPGFDAPTKLRVYLKGKEIYQHDARGSTAAELTVYYYLYPLEEGRFFSDIKGAVLEAVIKINPAREFPKFDSPKCAAIYSKFSEAELKLKNRNAALRKFFKDQVDPGREPSTRDTLPRICTLHHEAGHVRHGEKDYWNLLHNFGKETGKLGLRSSHRSPNARLLDLAKSMWRAWWSDYDSKEHQEIVSQQCELFINLYEKNRGRGFAKPLVHTGADVDEYALEVLKQIGDSIE